MRKALHKDIEVIRYIDEIRLLKRELDEAGALHDDSKMELGHNLKMKKHLLHHTLKSKIKLNKKAKKVKKTINNSRTSANNIDTQQMSENEVNAVLMRRYLKNQKNNSVQIAFGPLFDSSSRFKVMAKKPEF